MSRSNLIFRFTLKFLVFTFSITIIAWLLLARPFIFFYNERISLPHADPRLLEKHTRKISVDFFPRDWRHPENLTQIASYIADDFEQRNPKVSLQTYTVQGTQYSNVISEYGNPGKIGTVVIGAHYDAYGEYPGADDNASGVAGLLELGRLISSENLPFKVLLVAYTLEEPPFFRTSDMGSAVHAASLVQAKEHVHLMISLEMIGYFSDAANSQTYPIPLLYLLYPSRGNFLAIVGSFGLSTATLDLKKAFLESVDMPVLSINAPTNLVGVDFSDHLNYWNNGFDAVMITDTSFLRNRAYHSGNDTAELLDFGKMAQAVTGVYAYLLKLARVMR